MSKNLRAALVRLASEVPETRKHLLPLLEKTSADAKVKTVKPPVDFTKTTLQTKASKDQPQPVNVTNISIHSYDNIYDPDEVDDGAELRVRFSGRTNKDRLIYGDSVFLKGLKGHIKSQGFSPNSIDYSEHGMQGTNYVSLDVDSAFVKKWVEKKWLQTDK